MTNYFKTLLSGIKANIEKNSKNDWNANKDEIGYIENRPFYEETNTVDVNVADEDFIVEGYYGALSQADSTTVVQAFEAYLQTHSEFPETITVALDEENYELPFIRFKDNIIEYGAPYNDDKGYCDFSNYPINLSVLTNKVESIVNSEYNNLSLIIDNVTAIEDVPIYYVFDFLYRSQFNNDDEDAFYNFLDALYNDNFPESITLTVDDTDYILPKRTYRSFYDSTEYICYGAIVDEFVAGVNFSDYPICLDLNRWNIYFSPIFENFSTISITYDSTTYLDNAILANNDRSMRFLSGEEASLISQDIFNDLPDTITANIDGTIYQLPKVAYENEEGMTYLGYGASYHEYYIDFSNYPVFLVFMNQNGQATWVNNACKFYEQIENISLSYSIEKTTVHQIDKKFIPVVDIQVDDYIDYNFESENPVQNKVIADSLDDLSNRFNGFYVTAGQKSGTTLGSFATAEGQNTTSSGTNTHAEGFNSTASGGTSHAEGSYSKATGNMSHAEGNSTEASGHYSHAQNNQTIASGESSHAEGYKSKASNSYAHAEGYTTTASGNTSHAEGSNTTASGNYSHAEGYSTTASGIYSHSEGYGTTAQRRSQHVFGEYNVLDTAGTATTKGNYIEIVGKGTSTSVRSNARTLDWSGNETLAGTLTTGGKIIVGAAPTNDMDVATKKYVDEHATVFNCKTITIATTDWSSNVATISDSDITTNSIVFISPAPTSISDYNTAGIYCSAQSTGSLEFTCTATPSNSISINILIL